MILFASNFWSLSFLVSLILPPARSHMHITVLQWGHDFRPDYAKLQVLRQHFPRVPILAVTATASEQVRKDCVTIFKLSRDYAFFRSTADRPNLAYAVRPKESSVIQDMANFIREKHPRSAGIVYTYSRKDADTVACELNKQGIVSKSYHSEWVFSSVESYQLFLRGIILLKSSCFTCSNSPAVGETVSLLPRKRISTKVGCEIERR